MISVAAAAAAVDPSEPPATVGALEAWLRRLDPAAIPVLAETAQTLEVYRACEDDIDANRLGEMISADPLMTLKVLVHEAGHRTRRVVTSAETVTSALVMMGISPFFRAFGPQPVLEDGLARVDGAAAGWQRVLDRSRRGADFALAFAVHRSDPQAAVIHAAALLHEFAEMLIWAYAPEDAVRIRRLLDTTPGLRSRSAQIQVLGVDVASLQRHLIVAWRLPPLLDDVVSGIHSAGHTSPRTVALAARLARHTEKGWDDAALPDDIAEAATLLNLSPAAALAFLQVV